MYTIPTFDIPSGTAGERVFSSRLDFTTYVKSMFKRIGEYNLSRTDVWRQEAAKFDAKGYYITHFERSRDYIAYWNDQKNKCLNGVIYTLENQEYYVTGEYYMFLNFLPIIDKVQQKAIFPEVWDSHYHTCLYFLLAELLGKATCIVKKRQWGATYLHLVRPIRNLWFEKSSVNKLIAFEEDFVNTNGDWRIVEEYRNFLNTYTGWYRNFDPDGTRGMIFQQRIAVNENGKKVYKGNQSILKGITTKQSPTKSVGGLTTYCFFEESGINPTLDKSKIYMDSAMKMGALTTGVMRMAGSVGELKDCDPLKIFAFNPASNGILGVPGDEGEETCLFIAEDVNYLHVVKDENENIIEIIKCYDSDGNSDRAKAKEFLLASREDKKRSSLRAYTLYCSQHPFSLKEAFQTREENIFPVELLRRQEDFLISNYTPTTVELVKDEERIKHKFQHTIPPLIEYPTPPNIDKRGSVVILEFPPENPPTGMFYAGVDPTKMIKTSTSDSLFSIYIFKADHQMNGEFISNAPVAWYTGRWDNVEVSFETARRLIKYYNAQAAIENDQAAFIEWMIKKKEQQYMLKRSDMPILTELVPKSKIFEAYGFTTGSGTKIKEYFYELIINYCEEEIGKVFNDETGESQTIHGVTRIKDLGIIRELLNWSPSANTDRLIAFAAALMVTTSKSNRGLVLKSKEGIQVKLPVNSNVLVKSYTLNTPSTKRYKLG